MATATKKKTTTAKRNQKSAPAQAEATEEKGPTKKGPEPVGNPGDIVKYILRDGTEIDAEVNEHGRPACPTCQRALPKQKALSEEQAKKRAEREAKLQDRLGSDTRHIIDMLNKTRELNGKPPMTKEEAVQAVTEALVAEG